MTVYEGKLSMISSVEDSYKDGEIGDVYDSDPWFDTVRAESIPELLKEIQSKLYIDDDAKDVFSIDTHYAFENDSSTTIEASWMEDKEGNTISEKYDTAKIENWKAGKERLFSCRVLISISRIVLSPVSLSEFEKLDNIEIN